MKKVLLLNSSHNDLGLINGLKKLGYYIYVTGNVPDLIGQKYTDKYIRADFSDKDHILEIAKALKIDNICACCNDFGMYTASYVAEKLNLPGYDSYETTLILNNKDKFKTFAKKYKILSPFSYSFNNIQKAISWAYNQELPLISKAVDLSAGNGIHKIEKKDDIEFAIKDSFEKSRAKRIVIEPYITGSQHGFCTFLVNKKVVASCSNDEYSILNPYRVEIDTWPARGIEKYEEKLINQVETIASILDLKDGIFHLQYILSNGKPFIIEVMRRAIGNMYGYIASKYSGFDWDYWEARALTGHDCTMFPVNQPKDGFFAYKAILSDKNGVIKSIKIPDRYSKYLIDKCIIKKIGDRIDNNLSQPIGLMFFRFSSQNEMLNFLVNHYCNDIVEVN